MVLATVAAKPRRINHRMSNLFSLVWPVNTCCSEFMNGVPKGVTVNLTAGIWTFQGDSFPIGTSRLWKSEGVGHPIGVYDRTRLPDLKEFKRACEWVVTRHNPPGD